jgi:hypothetical protein
MAQFINRWLFSCSAKDIAVLYKAFAGFSGLIGSALSFMIRLELSGGGQVYFLGNNHDYNVMITAHGIFMIFFLVMPFLIGGLGSHYPPMVVKASPFTTGGLLLIQSPPAVGGSKKKMETGEHLEEGLEGGRGGAKRGASSHAYSGASSRPPTRLKEGRPNEK